MTRPSLVPPTMMHPSCTRGLSCCSPLTLMSDAIDTRVRVRAASPPRYDGLGAQDCEGCEWAALSHIASTAPRLLARTRLLMLELHVATSMVRPIRPVAPIRHTMHAPHTAQPRLALCLNCVSTLA